MYLSLACLFILGIVAQAAPHDASQNTYWLMLAIQVVILAGIIVRGIIDWTAKRRAHEEHLELLKLQRATASKVDHNTEITKETTRTIRHDVRNEITAMSMLNEVNKREIAVQAEAENQKTRQRFDELTDVVRGMGGNGKAGSPERPLAVEVVNPPDHPVPVKGETPRTTPISESPRCP